MSTNLDLPEQGHRLAAGQGLKSIRGSCLVSQVTELRLSRANAPRARLGERFHEDDAAGAQALRDNVVPAFAAHRRLGRDGAGGTRSRNVAVSRKERAKQ